MNSDVENGSVGSRTPLVLMFITVVILVYASLFPFNFAADYDRSLFDNLGYGVWQDRVGNILGFMPLGLCIVWASERLQSIARLCSRSCSPCCCRWRNSICPVGTHLSWMF